jgi:hypothetical protein
VADDVGQDEHGIVGGLVRRVGKVGVDWALLDAVWLYANQTGLLSPMFLNSPVASPWCLTPTVQHSFGGWEAIFLTRLVDCDLAQGEETDQFR